MDWIKGNGLIGRCAKVAMMVLVLNCFTGINSMYGATENKSNGKPYYAQDQNGSTSRWFALFCNYDGSQWSVNRNNETIYQVYSPCVLENCTIMARKGNSYYTQFHLKYYFENGNDTSINNDATANSWTWYTNLSPVNVSNNSNIYQLGVVCTDASHNTNNNTESGSLQYNNIHIALAPHILLDNGSKYGTSDTTIYLTPTPSGQWKKVVVPFRSFLTSGDMKVYLSSGNAANFKLINTTSNYTQSAPYTIVSGSDKCGIKNSDGGSGSDYSGTNHTPGDASLKDIVVYYTPSSATANESATFIITDGTKSATFTINGTGASTISGTSLSDGKPYFINDKWYSLYQSTATLAVDRGSNPYPSVALYQPCKESMTLSLRMVSAHSTGGTASNPIGQASDNSKQFALGYKGTMDESNNEATNYIYGWALKSTFDAFDIWRDFTINSSSLSGSTKGEFAFYNRAAANMQVSNMQVELANHITLVDASQDITSTPVEVGQKQAVTVQLSSFLLKNKELYVKLTDGDPQVFRLQAENGSEISTNAGAVVKTFTSGNVCGINGGYNGGDFYGTNNRPGDATDVTITVYYYPSTTSNETATFGVYDGTNTSGTPAATFTITAKGAPLSTTEDHCSNGKPFYAQVKNGNGDGTYKWFSLYASFASKKTISTAIDHTDYQVFVPTVTEHCFAAYFEPVLIFYTSITNSKYCFSRGSSYSAGWETAMWPENSESEWFRVKHYNGTGYYNHLQIPLATHIRLYDLNNTSDNNVTSLDETMSTNVLIPETCTVYLRSFLTKTNLKMKVVNKSDDNPSTLFKIKSVGGVTVDATTYTLTEISNICGYRNGTTANTVFDNPGTPINTEQLPIVIEYYTENVSSNDEAQLIIYDDGTTQSATVNLTASAVKQDATLTITELTSMYRYEKTPLTVTTNNTDDDYAITLTCTDYSGSNVATIDQSSIKSGETFNVTALNGGTAQITVSIAETDHFNAANKTFTVAVNNGTLSFVGSDNDHSWNTISNWRTASDNTPVQVPTASDNVQIQAVCEVPNESIAYANNVSFGNDGSLTINPQGVLDVTSITNSDVARLWLKADLNNSASVLFTSGTNPKATVECWFKGKSTHKSTDTQSDDYHIMIPEWQYRGFIGYPDNTLCSGSSDMYIWLIKDVLYYKWLESKNSDANATNCWDETNPNKNAAAWDGFSMANVAESCTTQVYTTTLIPTNTTHEFTLTRSGDKATSGLNLFTNSFSAPVKIGEIDFGTGMVEEIVFFNTANYETVQKATDKMSLYTTCPKYTDQVTTSAITIPAGQSFFCYLNSGNTSSTITIPAPQSQASGEMYAPRVEEEFNVLKIYAESESERDEVYLVESEKCTHNYDNGYDGTKYFTEGMGQIYGKNEFGRTFIAADSSMLGQMIGFRAGSNDMTYRLRFDIERLSGYDELYLYDRVTKRYVNILEGGTYEFVGTTEGEDERFQIIGRMEDGEGFVTGSDHAIEVVGERALLRGFDGEDEVVYMTDLAGRVVWSDNAKRGPWFELPKDIASGLYIIHCGDATAKYLKR